MKDALDKLRSRRSVLKRTKARADLPRLVIYMDWLPGQMRRRVLDTDGKEHLIDDAVLQSHFKLVTGAQAKDLIAEHWADVYKEVADQKPATNA